jgi:hypothetical protein
MRFLIGISLLSLILLAACSSPTSSPSEGYPLDTMTGLSDVDTVLAAVASGDPGKLRARIQYTRAPCTWEDGLGGPPKCREGEAEGTLLEVLPLISSEGGHIRRNEISSWQGIDEKALYAVYRVSENALDEKYYPPGDYIVFFVPGDNQTTTALRVAAGGIVRVDTIFGEFPDSIKKTVERDTSEVILPPKER